MFQLTDEEYDNLRFQSGTSKVRGGRRYNQYVFTEQGVAVLSSVLHTEIAIKMSIQIINAFVTMRKYISSNLTEQKFIKKQVLKNIEVIIITKKDNLLTNQDITIYNKQYHNLKVIFNSSFHDRYFLIDEREVYHYGTSINRIGYKTFSINLISDEEVYNLLINKVNKIIMG